MIWSHSINYKTKLRKLQQINRLVSMMMAPARRSTPTRALELINNLMPLDIYLHELSLKAYNQHKQLYELDWAGKHPTHKTRIGHLYFWQTPNGETLGELEILDTTRYKAEERDYNIIINNLDGRNKPKLSQINIYTDGSKTDTGTGSGYVIMKGKHTV